MDSPGPLVLSLEGGISEHRELSLSPGLPLNQPFPLSECWLLHVTKGEHHDSISSGSSEN